MRREHHDLPPSRSTVSTRWVSAACAAAHCALAGALSLGVLSGCVKTTSSNDGRAPTPPPVAPPSTPGEAPANAVVLITRPAVDTNGNLWRDRIDLTVYLFAQPFPTPVFREGELEFLIYPMGRSGTQQSPGKPLRTWRFDAAMLNAMRGMSLPGPCYNLSISLLADGGTDKLPLDAVDLAACFRAPGEAPVWTQALTTVQLGTVAGDAQTSGQTSPPPKPG